MGKQAFSWRKSRYTLPATGARADDMTTRLFTLDGGRRRDPAVERWLAESLTAPRAAACRWFDELRACGPDVVELLHDGQPTVCVENAAFAYVGAFRQHANVGFFLGAVLPDPAGLLAGDGAFMRHVKVRPGAAIDDAALRGLIRAAYADIKARLAAR